MTARFDSVDTLLADLTEEQSDAVTTSAPQLCILAGAGSGKTRVLTRRIAWQTGSGAMDPRRVLAVTFTRRAAGELRRRLRTLGLRDEVAAGTFHSVSLAILRRYWADQDRRAPEILERRMAFLAKNNPKINRATIADLDSEIGWARTRLATPETYTNVATDAGRRPPRSGEFTAEIYAAYNEAKRKRRLVDFDDLLALCHATMTGDESFAAAQRWRHRHLLVDEFQDVNPLQFALLQSWLGPESTLLVVGDPNQAIYGWNGAEPDLLRDIDQHLPGVAVVTLRTNFRSSPEILASAGRVIAEEPQPASRPGGDEPTIRVLEGDEEAIGIARAVRGCHRPGAPWRHQAVLARTNAQLPPLRAALETAGIPTRSRGEGAILRRPEIIDLVDRWEATEPLAAALTDARVEEQAHLTVERAAMVDAFFDLARDHLVLEPEATVEEFLAALQADDRVGQVADGVELTTFHGAKGLEWPIVHLVGVEDGYVPIAFARRAAAREEERRLLYVATTRAERELHVSWCRTRVVGDQVAARQPSPWIDAFTVEAPPLPDERPSIASLRASLAPRPDIDLTAIDAEQQLQVKDVLEKWRDHAAVTADVAPSAVLSDAAIDTLATLRPCTISDLAAVPGVGPGKAHRFGLQLLELTCLDE